eukprot:Sspe_Gene.80850::Locus_51311_Transcript_1_1_Confidence_1.000_Length_2866::g.80850::m.80850
MSQGDAGWRLPFKDYLVSCNVPSKAITECLLKKDKARKDAKQPEPWKETKPPLNCIRTAAAFDNIINQKVYSFEGEPKKVEADVYLWCGPFDVLRKQAGKHLQLGETRTGPAIAHAFELPGRYIVYIGEGSIPGDIIKTLRALPPDIKSVAVVLSPKPLRLDLAFCAVRGWLEEQRSVDKVVFVPPKNTRLRDWIRQYFPMTDPSTKDLPLEFLATLKQDYPSAATLLGHGKRNRGKVVELRHMDVVVGDITALAVDAIVVRWEGSLYKELVARSPLEGEVKRCLQGVCCFGNAKIAWGYELPARYVVFASTDLKPRTVRTVRTVRHAVQRSLDLAVANKANTVAISNIAVTMEKDLVFAVRDWLAQHTEFPGKIVFVERDEVNAGFLRNALLCARGPLQTPPPPSASHGAGMDADWAAELKGDGKGMGKLCQVLGYDKEGAYRGWLECLSTAPTGSVAQEAQNLLKGGGIEGVGLMEIPPINSSQMRPEYRDRLAVFEGNLDVIRGDACIVASDKSLRPLCGKVRDSAGVLLEQQCMGLAPVDEGRAVCTWGYRLPFHRIIHAVGLQNPETVSSSLQSALSLASELKVQTLAIGIPTEVAHEVVDAVLRWLTESTVLRVVFAVDTLQAKVVDKALRDALFGSRPAQPPEAVHPPSAPTSSPIHLDASFFRDPDRRRRLFEAWSIVDNDENYEAYLRALSQQSWSYTCASEAQRVLQSSKHHSIPASELKWEGKVKVPHTFRVVGGKTLTVHDTDVNPRYPVVPAVTQRIALHHGDITKLAVDAVVNAANTSLMGGGGIDGAIHSKAGALLQLECETLRGCAQGGAKVTRGYGLPAKHVLHTVGPTDGNARVLESCYREVLKLAEQHRVRSLALCCIAVGIYGFPLISATHIALKAVREWLDSPNNTLDKVIFVVFRDEELWAYQSLLPAYFPSHNPTGSGAHH